MIYLYMYVGEMVKIQYWVWEVMNCFYYLVLDGYCGDEDNGQMFVWYVFFFLGFYLVCLVIDEYVLGVLQFRQVKIYLFNGSDVEIIGVVNSFENCYWIVCMLNGNFWKNMWILFKIFFVGCNLKFDMLLFLFVVIVLEFVYLYLFFICER